MSEPALISITESRKNLLGFRLWKIKSRIDYLDVKEFLIAVEPVLLQRLLLEREEIKLLNQGRSDPLTTMISEITLSGPFEKKRRYLHRERRGWGLDWEFAKEVKQRLNLNAVIYETHSMELSMESRTSNRRMNSLQFRFKWYSPAMISERADGIYW